MSEPATRRIEVAAGVLQAPNGCVLLARRADDAHQGGLWEFPGGKLHAEEDARTALQRELGEELGIEVVSARPLIRVTHDYPDVSVLLDTWRVDAWRGEVHGREGQPLAWVHPEALHDYPMPAADRPIITAIRLPSLCLVTPSPDADRDGFLDSLRRALDGGIRLVQLRAPSLSPAHYLELLEAVRGVCAPHDARVMANPPAGLGLDSVLAAGVEGLHLNTVRLRQTASRPVPDSTWLSASCHDEEELAHARRVGCDFVLLSPVCSTPTHAEATPLGWERFARLAARAHCPVYALGGMHRHDCSIAWQAGAQGIAAIRSLWPPAPARQEADSFDA